MLDLQYIYDICAENGIEIVSDGKGLQVYTGPLDYHFNWAGSNQAGYVPKARKILLSDGIPSIGMEATMLHELGHGLGELGNFSPPPCMTSELAADKWVLTHYRGANLMGVKALLSEWLNGYIENGINSASHKSELLETALTLGIADAITWRD